MREWLSTQPTPIHPEHLVTGLAADALLGRGGSVTGTDAADVPPQIRTCLAPPCCLPSNAVKASNLLAERRRKALALNDNVVQRLAAALLALDVGMSEESRHHVERALRASQEMVSDLIRGSHGEATLGPGELADGVQGAHSASPDL